jgi:signal peptidase I
MASKTVAKNDRSSSKNSRNVVADARRGKAPKGKRSPGGRSAAWENTKSLLGAVVIYLVIRTLFVEAYRIPSGSMIPTLLVGDWLFVNKLVYGPTIPFTNKHLPGYSAPHRGDVAVFVSPPQVDAPQDPTPTLVKRLIGMPGDTLYMRQGVVYVNGIAQRQGCAAAHSPTDTAAANVADPLYEWQHRIEVRGTRFGAPPATPTHDNWGPLLIPADHYFMMGDNRYESKDSRYWGVVPRANFRGRPLFVYYSYVPGDESDRPVSFITDIRWRRIGHWIR